MSLEPLRHALLHETAIEVDRHRAEIDVQCAAVIAAAEATARDLTEQGRQEGERAAAQEAGRRRAVATRRAREIRLRAQREQFEELQRRSQAAVLSLREDDRYQALIASLTAAVREQLGPAAEIEPGSPKRGGVIGRKGGASVDYTLPALAERAVASLGDELTTLWT